MGIVKNAESMHSLSSQSRRYTGILLIHTLYLYSPHESLHLAGLLRPFKSPVQKNVSSGQVYGEKPHSLEPKTVIVPLVEYGFDCLEYPLSHGIWLFQWRKFFFWARTRDVKPPYQPRHNQIPRFDECRCNDRECSCEKPDKDEAGSMTRNLLLLPLLLPWLPRRGGIQLLQL